MKIVLFAVALVALTHAAPQSSLPADLQPEQMVNYLDNPETAEALIQCLSDFGASSGITCPEGLRHANELAGSLGAEGGCTTCTAEENATFAEFRQALAQRPALLSRFVQVFLPRLTNQGK